MSKSTEKELVPVPPAVAEAPASEEEVAFTIGDLAAEFGITTRTIRFYEARGLLSPLRRGTNRSYSRRDRARLRLILRGKNLGFTLQDIGDTSRSTIPTRPRSPRRSSCSKRVEALSPISTASAPISTAPSTTSRTSATSASATSPRTNRSVMSGAMPGCRAIRAEAEETWSRGDAAGLPCRPTSRRGSGRAADARAAARGAAACRTSRRL
jgi:hypothetical protein